MTIRAGINPGAVLWKYKITRQRQYYNQETQMYDYRDYHEYYGIKLVTRRARTNGHVITSEAKPFFESIRIKLIPHRIYRNNAEHEAYVAVGTESFRIRNEEEYEALQFDEVASRWYFRLKNNGLSALLTPRSDQFSFEIIDEMKEAAKEVEEEVDEWPPEPRLREYSMHISPGYYRTINW